MFSRDRKDHQVRVRLWTEISPRIDLQYTAKGNCAKPTYFVDCNALFRGLSSTGKGCYDLLVMPDNHGSVFTQFAKASNSKDDTISKDESSAPLPKGVVLGKDGKPYDEWPVSP
jgi:hypothetical protein